MTRAKYFLAAFAVVAALVVVAPSAHAVVNPCAGNAAISCHVVGAGSSAQFLTAALGADSFAFNNVKGLGQCSFHYTAGSAAQIADNRDGGVIRNEPGNLWVVWVANQDGGTCATSVGNTGITDVWLDVSVDSTVGVRSFLAQLASGSGATVSVNNPIPADGTLVSPQTLWADNQPDTALPTNLASAIAGSHVNTGLTDIRPEDALFATARAYTGKANCTGSGNCSKLGYTTSDARIGSPIQSDLAGSSAIATPVDFALSGADPFGTGTVRSYTTVPIGAAPIVFAYNNNNEAVGTYPTDLKTGINPGHTGGTYELSRLFDGTTTCDESNVAFNNGAHNATAIIVALREPLSGTMNTTEFNLFHSFGDTLAKGSQEWGINPALGGGGAGTSNNPLDLNCTGNGKRVRGIGTGEITKWVKNNANTLGYIFWGFANANSIGSGNAKYNSLTLDGVDGIGIATTNHELPACAGPCPATLWPLDSNGNINSFPNVRNGSYKAWSLYRWLVPSPDTDTFGPSALAANTQQQVDISYADYIPFISYTGTISGVNFTEPGLSVYRSHSDYCNVGVNPCPLANKLKNENNGSASGNTLGGGTELGSDVGGLVYGPFPGSGVNQVNEGASQLGVVDVTHGSVTVSWDAGQKFPANTQWVGQTILLDATVDATGVCQGTAYTIASTTATSLKLTAAYAGATNDTDNACTPVQTPGGAYDKHQ